MQGTRRSGGISHFLLGLHEKKLTASDIAQYADRKRLPPKLYAFCKVGSGYSIARLQELRKELETKWQPYDKDRQPPHFMGSAHSLTHSHSRSCPSLSESIVDLNFSSCGSLLLSWQHERSDIPDVWIDPRDSVTFEIKAYEITACRPNKFSAGLVRA